MFRLKTPLKNPSTGMAGQADLTVTIQPLGDFATLEEAFAEAKKRGLTDDRAVVEDLDHDQQLSIKEWRQKSS